MSTPAKRGRKSAARQDENKENQAMEVDPPMPPVEDDDMNDFDDEEGILIYNYMYIMQAYRIRWVAMARNYIC